jgi:hypothetical protein
MQGTHMQGPGLVTLENIVSQNKPLRALLGPNLHSLFSSLHSRVLSGLLSKETSARSEAEARLKRADAEL